ncbi:MAG: 1-deoxy-D-xylulose-5-phosphate reductoisomerase [Dehalococcoidales bacterium]|nr:1-deoxy-D-xylulose-5-phosphate reductoisomerase [Dehalococcoidales bacterium]
MVAYKSPKRLAVLGSTGSIGRQTLDIVRGFPDRFQIKGLAAGHNLELLQKQIAEFKPEVVCFMGDKSILSGERCGFLPLEDMAVHPHIDLVVIATSGKAGLAPTLSAIGAGKQIALANKEALVMAGEIIQAALKNSSGRILPVDSEHSAVWQCMAGEPDKPARIILTASGGPFLQYTAEQLSRVTVEDALKHPSWKMGKKVTVDSATLMNKGLEVIEAHWLFDMPYDNIEILLHPQSIIHSMIQMADGTLKAQLSCPDMRFPIQYALSYPERLPNPGLPVMDWGKYGSLVFKKPDYNLFPCLKTAIEAGRQGGTYPAVLCAADEIAVDLFLKRRLGFTSIAGIVQQVLGEHSPSRKPSLKEIMEADEWARRRAYELCNGVS